MKILAVSDTHSQLNNLSRIFDNNKYDAVFHLGDGQGQEDYIEAICDCPLHIVRGNCDIFSSLPDELFLEIAGKKMYLTHGHLFRAKQGYEGLVNRAKEIGADYVFFGHTHVPKIIKKDGIVLVNPGSLTYNRDPKGPTYIEIDAEGTDIALSLHYV